MNILITGGNGFLAKEMNDYFSNSEKEYNIILTDRKSMDVTNYEDVKRMFETNKIDIVIHTAVQGGKRGAYENIDHFMNNFAMFQNLIKFRDQFKFMFNFGSGAEFDRRFDINNKIEINIWDQSPRDLYGLAKNLITRKIYELDSNVFNLRLFGCFGIHEESQRLFRTCYDKFSKGINAIITQDKYMDYFYAQDVGRVIENIVTNYNDYDIPRDINLSYSKKYKLSDYAGMIKDLTKNTEDVIIESENMANAYTGDSFLIEDLEINLIGLQRGMEECLKNWSKS